MTYPNYPGMRPAEGGGEPPPTAGTAITAGVLAVLGGLFFALAAWLSFDAVDLATDRWAEEGLTSARVAELEALVPDWVETYGVITGIIAVLASLLLLLGAFFLLSRTVVGRWLVVAGCVFAIGFAVAGMIALPTLRDDIQAALEQQLGQQARADDGPDAVGAAVFLIIIPAVATLILALVPATGKWLNAGRRRPMPAMPLPSPPMQPGQW